jgi:uncharacterized membrane protein
MKDLIIKALLYTHIAAGGLSLVMGAVALSVVKGGKTHRTVGKIFFVAMLFVSFSAFVISIVKSLDFLLAISIFSFYMNYTGYRVLKNRVVKFKWFEWLPLVFSVATVAYMFYSMNVVLLVFGALLSMFILQDIRLQFQDEEAIKKARQLRVLTHIGRMGGTYIATVTAFLVVNIKFVKPWWIVWLLPTVIGTLLITYFTREWTKKLAPKV